MLRSVLGIVLGFVLGTAVIAGLETLGHVIYPPAKEVDFHNPEAVKAYMAVIPLGALLFVLLAFAAGAFVGGWVAAWVARRAPALHALIVGGFFLLAGIANLMMIPHPLWFAIVNLLIFLPFAYAGSLLVRRPTPASAPV